MVMDSNCLFGLFISDGKVARYVFGHTDVQELEVSLVSLLSSQAWKLLEALMDKGVCVF